MKKAWHIVSAVAMSCILLGVVGMAVGFFTGSSPSVIESHGHIGQYAERLSMNWAVLKQNANLLMDQVQAFLAGLF